MRRRHFLTLSAATLGGVLIYSLDRKASLLAAQHKPVRIPLRSFTETEALIVAAAASRIFPSDDSGPGAREAGVAVFIDRQLAGSYGRDRSEERRVGKECRSRGAPYHSKKKETEWARSSQRNRRWRLRTG